MSKWIQRMLQMDRLWKKKQQQQNNKKNIQLWIEKNWAYKIFVRGQQMKIDQMSESEKSTSSQTILTASFISLNRCLFVCLFSVTACHRVYYCFTCLQFLISSVSFCIRFFLLCSQHTNNLRIACVPFRRNEISKSNQQINKKKTNLSTQLPY